MRLTVLSPLSIRFRPGVSLFLATVLFVCLVAAQIALPLVESAREQFTTAVVVILAALAFVVAAKNNPKRRILGVALTAVALSIVAEAIGIRTGLPFGYYHYTDLLQPQIFGVPLIVPLAWFAMGVPAWEASRHLIHRNGPLQWVVGGLMLAAWDLLLDPQMVANGYWVWREDGAYFGIPLSNYLGWTLIGTIICFVCSRVLDRSERSPSNPGLVLIYIWMAFMTSLGFLLPFVFDRPMIGVIGGFAMILPAVTALKRFEKPWLL